MPKPQPKKAAKKPAQKAKASKPASKPAAKHKPGPKAVQSAKPAKPAKAAKPSKPAKAAKVAAKPVNHVIPNSTRPVPGKPVKLTPFLKQQRQRLMALRDTILDSMAGVAKDTLRSRPEGSEASAFGMHQADAGSDAYDKDFALSLLSQEQDALYEIEEALKRVDNGTYGVCEMSGKPISHLRLEALPFARCTVECQADLEKNKRFQRSRVPVTSLFGLTDSEGESDGEADEPEETPAKPQED
ncbi:MAG: TraR/DksA C4-type zinc finger protein [Chthoniobacteraceae bacterium]